MSTQVENFPSLVGPRIEAERKRLKLSQDRAATACGVSREMWGKYERGKAVMGTEVLYRFVEAGADESYILTGRTQQERMAEFAAGPSVRALEAVRLLHGDSKQDKAAPPTVDVPGEWRDLLAMFLDVMLAGPPPEGMNGQVVIEMVDKMYELRRMGIKLTSEVMETMLTDLLKRR